MDGFITSDFHIFYKNYEEDMRCYANVHRSYTKENIRQIFFRFLVYLGLVLQDLI